MIEVEIRGRLSDEQFVSLSERLARDGTLKETQDREMILLRGYPGYSADPTARDVDIRLRSTNGKSEIMVKQKTSDHNVARREISLPLAVPDLALAKEAMKALGYADGIWMHRIKSVYEYRGIEWSIVDVPEGLRYFEAEQEVSENEDTTAVHAHLVSEAEKLGLVALEPLEMKEFIQLLDTTVNKEISW
jgi:predicted adenylyl cyclase CyaB